MQTIDDVLIQLDAIIDHCTRQPSRQAYFAVLYRQMTAAVKTGIQNGSFQDGPRMAKLDVLFASRYVDAWKAYQEGKPTTRSWNFALTAAKEKLTVFQHLLLGINTHINLDLSIAAAYTAPGDAIFDLQSDFERINDVIADLSIQMQEKLSNIWWPMRFVSKLSKGSENAVLNFSIEKARKAAWANAVAMAMADEPSTKAHIHNLDNVVLEIAQKIKSPGKMASIILAPVRWFETSDISTVVKKLQ